MVVVRDEFGVRNKNTKKSYRARANKRVEAHRVIGLYNNKEAITRTLGS